MVRAIDFGEMSPRTKAWHYSEHTKNTNSLNKFMETPLKVPFSPLNQPHKELAKEALDTIADIVSSGDFTLGGAVTEFEIEFQKWSGGQVIAVNSGTDALKLSLLAAGVKPGDSVIVPAHTFIATIGAVVEIGAEPVLIDVDPVSGLMDPEKARIALRYGDPRPKAIIPVHWAGSQPDCSIFFNAWDYRVTVVEDACQAFGAHFLNSQITPAGSLGDFGAFSLHPLKNMHVWGDGGVIVCKDPEHAKKLRLLRNHGLVGRDKVEIFGMNSRLDSVQAAVGLATIKRIHDQTKFREEMVRTYHGHLGVGASLHGVRPCHKAGPLHLYQFHVDPMIRDQLLHHLTEAGIEAKVHYPVPLHLQPCFGGKYKKGDFPGCEAFCASHITLPLHSNLTNVQIDYMFDKIREWYGIVKDDGFRTFEEVRARDPDFDEVLPAATSKEQAGRYLLRAAEEYAKWAKR